MGRIIFERILKMASFNEVILMGRLCAEPELKQTNTGVPVTSFSLAVDRRNSSEEKKCDFITIIAWRHTAEFINKYFSKGSAILLRGELQTRTWKDNQGNTRYATEVVANEVFFCEAKRELEGNYAPRVQNTAQEQNTQSKGFVQQSIDDVKRHYGDDDLPF